MSGNADTELRAEIARLERVIAALIDRAEASDEPGRNEQGDLPGGDATGARPPYHVVRGARLDRPPGPAMAPPTESPMSQTHAPTTDYAQHLNASPEPWVAANGLTYVKATADEMVADVEVLPSHRQAYGIVHGGVYAGIIETLASVGATLHGLPEGRMAVGLENHTSFIHAVRGGRLRARALPLTRGRRSQAWEVTITDDASRTVATGRVRLLMIEAGSDLAGAKAALVGSDKA